MHSTSRPDPQLPPARLPAAVPVRRLSGRLFHLRGGAQARTADALAGHRVHAAWHLAAHGPAGLPERGAGQPGRELQQPGGLCRLAARGAHAAYPAYEKVGIVNPGGEYNQLATTLLQIENEFYGTIRPKRVIRPGERPARAARTRRRVRGSAADGPRSLRAGRHQGADPALPRRVPAAPAGRQPGRHAAGNRGTGPQPAPHRCLRPRSGGGAGARWPRAKLTDWGAQIVAECAPIAAQLDAVHNTTDYSDALRAAEALLQNPRCCLRRACCRPWRASMATASRPSRWRSRS